MVGPTLVGSGETVSEQKSCKSNNGENSAESEETEPVCSEFGTHMLEIDPVGFRCWWAHITIACKQRAGAESIGVLITFTEGEKKLIPLVFNARELVAVN